MEYINFLLGNEGVKNKLSFLITGSDLEIIQLLVVSKIETDLNFS